MKPMRLTQTLIRRARGRAMLMAGLGLALAAAGTAQAVTRTWDGGGGDNLASTAANWSDDTRPTSGDHVVLNSTTNKNMTWDAGVNDLPDTVASWTQTEDYPGTVTFLTRYGASGFTNFTITGDCVVSNGVWTHENNSNSQQYRLRLSVGGGLTVGPSARIDASAKGYSSSGPGGHGGRRTTAEHTYGSCLEPTSLGTQGDARGGGAVYLTVGGEARIDGQILATGAYGYYMPSHGGSIYLRAGSLSGTGTHSVRGGEIAGNGVGGGGGRLAVVLTNSDDFASVVNTARGGIRTSGQGNDASAGTIYLEGQSLAGGQGRLIIDNSSRPYVNLATDIYGSHPTLTVTSDLSRVTLIVTNRTRVALTHDVPLGYLIVAGADARVDLRGRKLSVYPDMNLNGTLYGLGTYTTNQLAGGLVVDSVGGGLLEVRPVVDNANGATHVTTTGATLNGNLHEADDSTALFALWGPRDAGTDVERWAYTNALPTPISTGAYSVQIGAPDLLPNTVYYYRFYTTNSTRAMIASESSVFMTSEVTVEKKADAYEAGLVPGAFTFSRHADATNGAITVSYSIGGTAQPGVHYVGNLGTSIAFAEGAAQAERVVTPLQDDASQNDETIVLSLTGAFYEFGTPSEASLVIFNAGYPNAPTNTWIGAGNASVATNWSLGHAPTAGEDVWIGGFSKANLMWDIDGAVASWVQTEQYTGTVTVQTVYGAAGFTNLAIAGDCDLRGGRWTHPANAGTQQYRLAVTVGGNLVISNVTITADARGYASGSGYRWLAGYGAAHGGAAPNTDGSLANTNVHGFIDAPVNLGGGGASGHGIGGGAIQLTVAGTTTVSSASVLSANAGGHNYSDQGAGGSVFLTSGWLTGGGTLRANGGGSSVGGSGSGGRVAIVLTGAGADFASWSGSATAYGGDGGAGKGDGAAGTVYLKTAAGADTLIVDNNNAVPRDDTNSRNLEPFGQLATLMPAGTDLNAFSNVVIRNKGVLGVRAETVVNFETFAPTVYGPAASFIAIDNDASVTYPENWTFSGYTLVAHGITPNKIGNLTVAADGAMTHYQNKTADLYRLNLAISGNLTVHGTISADARGFNIGFGTGYLTGHGAAHGGAGRDTGAGVNVNTYGTLTAPVSLGSGGNHGIGGGSIVLTVGGTTTLSATGTITANSGGHNWASAGSGGSINLRTGWLSGNGTIRANGVSSGSSGSGGGGRVAVVLTGAGADFSEWSGANTAYGGAGTYPAAAGTVYRQAAGDAAGAGTVIVNNGSTVTNRTTTSLPAFLNRSENLKLTS